jgi:hypothetical protein
MEIERLELRTKMLKTIFIVYNIDIIRIKNSLRKLNDRAILHFSCEYDDLLKGYRYTKHLICCVCIKVIQIILRCNKRKITKKKLVLLQKEIKTIFFTRETPGYV